MQQSGAVYCEIARVVQALAHRSRVFDIDCRHRFQPGVHGYRAATQFDRPAGIASSAIGVGYQPAQC
jgi:hypothetical protein